MNESNLRFVLNHFHLSFYGKRPIWVHNCQNLIKKEDFLGTNLSGVHQALTIHWDGEATGFRQKTAIEYPQNVRIGRKDRESAFMYRKGNLSRAQANSGFVIVPLTDRAVSSNNACVGFLHGGIQYGIL